MKKFYLLVALSVATLGLMKAQSFKADGGKVTSDFTFIANGILNKEPVSLSNGMFKLRYFLMDDLALRAGIGFSTTGKREEKPGDVLDKEVKSSSNYALGVEYHFAGTRRLSPYLGVELGLSSESQKSEKKTDKDNGMKIEGPSSFGFDGGLLLGADYYMLQHVYIGVEGKLGMNRMNMGKVKTTVINAGTSTTTTSEAKGYIHNTYTQVGFKIGFTF